MALVSKPVGDEAPLACRGCCVPHVVLHTGLYMEQARGVSATTCGAQTQQV